MIRDTPYIAEEAIAFLVEFLKPYPSKRVLEFGAGSSTIFFSRYAKTIYSIESNKEYALRVCDNLETLGLPRLVTVYAPPYYKFCMTLDNNSIDLVLIDGLDRVECARHSISLIKRNGYIMLDNSDRNEYQPIFEMLKDWKQVEAHQKVPDKFGNYNPDWKTTWWQKP